MAAGRSRANVRHHARTRDHRGHAEQVPADPRRLTCSSRRRFSVTRQRSRTRCVGTLKEPQAQCSLLACDLTVEQAYEGLLGHVLSHVRITGQPVEVPEERREDLVGDRVEIYVQKATPLSGVYLGRGPQGPRPSLKENEQRCGIVTDHSLGMEERACIPYGIVGASTSQRGAAEVPDPTGGGPHDPHFPRALDRRRSPRSLYRGGRGSDRGRAVSAPGAHQGLLLSSFRGT